MFELAEPTDALLDHVTLRNERHGKEKVRAVTLRFKITGPNTLLDLLSPTLRHALYMRDDAQEALPGVEAPTPLLRSKDITTVPDPQKLVEGATVHIEHGIDDGNEICLGGSKVDGFSIEAHDGGTVDLSLRVSSSDVSREEIGLIADKWSTVVKLRIDPPMIAPPAADGVIDGSADAFHRDYPDADAAPTGQGLFDDDGGDDATDAFIAHHGDAEGDTDGEDAVDVADIDADAAVEP